MSDLISRQAAIDAVRKIPGVVSPIFDDMLLIDKAEVQTELMMLPSAQPEIIRCKDCKHRYHSVECPCQSYDHFYSWMPADDWFCKKGERKEE